MVTLGFVVSAQPTGSITVKLNTPPFPATSKVLLVVPFCMILMSGVVVIPSP